MIIIISYVMIRVDINMCLVKAWTAINRLSIIWKSDLSNKIKHNFFQTAAVSILLYGCTTWTLTKHIEKKLDPNECPGYDTKQSDGKVPAVLELWGIRSTPSLPSLQGPLWPGVIAPDRALSIG